MRGHGISFRFGRRPAGRSPVLLFMGLRQARRPTGTARRKIGRARMAAVLALAFAVAAAAGAQTFDEALRLHTEGHAREALTAYRAVARSAAPPEERAAALNNACVLAGELGEHAAALADCEAALRLR